MKAFKYLISAAMILSSSSVFAHGEDKPGPHGGVIRMPGTYHTEVVLLGANKLKVYLLDINWKNPSVKDSSAEVRFGEEKTECEKKTDYFVCTFDKDVDLKSKGKLIVESMREKQRGNAAAYEVPLSVPHKSH